MASRSTCPVLGICSLQWSAFKVPATSGVSLRSLVGKDLGAVNLNWFEECGGDASFTAASCDLENSSLLTDVETVLKGDITKSIDATGSPVTFPTKDVSDHNSSNSFLLGDNNFYSAALSLPKNPDPVHVYGTENIVCDNKCSINTSFSYQTSPVTDSEKNVKTHCISPDTNTVLEGVPFDPQTVEVQDLCYSGRSRQLIWSPVTEQEESPQIRFPAFQTPQSYRNLSSTPRHVTLSLGIDPHDSELKWSPSMETPTLPSQSKKSYSMATPDQNSVAYDVRDKTHNSPHDTQDLSGNFSGSGSLSKSCSSSTKCKGYHKKQTPRRLHRLSKKKARQLFHGRTKDDYNDSSCHQNHINKADICSVLKDDVLCLPSELNAALCVPVLQKNISSTLEFLFAAPLNSREMRGETSKKSFWLSFQCEEYVRHALFHPGRRTLFCDMRVIDMNQYLPNVWTNTAAANYFTDASKLNERTDLHLQRLAYAPQAGVLDNEGIQLVQNTVQQKEMRAAPLLSNFKRRISEAVLKGAHRSYSLLSSLQDENDGSVSSFPSHNISYSQFSITGNVALNDVVDSKSFLDCGRGSSGSCHSHCTAISVTKSNESCSCVQYEWEFCCKDGECENLSTCLMSSGNFPKDTRGNLNSVPQLPAYVSDVNSRENFQMCPFSGHFAHSSKALLPKSILLEQLGISSVVTCPEFGKTVKKITNESDTGLVKMRVKKMDTCISNLFSAHSSFSNDIGVISDIMNRCSSVLIDFPLLKYISSNLANHCHEFGTHTIKSHGYVCNKGLGIPLSQHCSLMSSVDASSPAERPHCCRMPVEFSDENQKTATQTVHFNQLLNHKKYNIFPDVALTEPGNKSNEVLCNTQFVTDGLWTQSFDKMDIVLGGIPSQIYACSKLHGVTDGGIVLKETGVNEATFPSGFSSAAFTSSERKGNKTKSPKSFVDSSLLLQLSREYSSEQTCNGNYEISSCLRGNENICLQDNIPSQFFRLPESSFSVSSKAFGEKHQVKLIPDSQNEIKMINSVDFHGDSCTGAQSGDMEKPVQIVKSPVDLNLSQNSVGINADLNLMCLSKCGSDSQNVFDPNVFTSICGNYTNISLAENDLHHKPASTNIEFGVVGKNIVVPDNKQKSNMYLMDDTISDKEKRTEVIGSIINSVLSRNNDKIAGSSFTNLSESHPLNFTVATRDVNTFVSNHNSMKPKEMVSMKTFSYSADTKYCNNRCNQNFYSYLSQDDQDDVSIVPATSNAAVNISSDNKCVDSKCVCHDNSGLEKKIKKLNECHDNVRPLPLEAIVISTCKTSFPDQTEKLPSFGNGDGNSHIYQQGNYPNQLPQGTVTHDAHQNALHAVFVDQDPKEGAIPSKKVEDKIVLDKESKTVVPEGNDKILGTSTCETEATFENSKHLHLQLALSGFKTASEKNISISGEAFCQAVTMFNQIYGDLPASETVVSPVSSKAGILGELNHETETIFLAKRKLSQTDYDTKSNVKLSRVSDFEFQTASGKKLKISEEALKMAKTKFDEISLHEGIVNDELFTSTSVGCENICKVHDRAIGKRNSSSSDGHGDTEELDVIDCKRLRKSVENDHEPLPIVPQCCDKNADVNSFEKENESLTKGRIINTGNQLKMAAGSSRMPLRNQNNKPTVLENTSVSYQLTDKSSRSEMKSNEKDIDYETYFCLFNTASEDICCQKVKSLPSKQVFDDGVICETKIVSGNTFPVGFETAAGHKVGISDDVLETAKRKPDETGFGERNADDEFLNSKFNTSFESDFQVSSDTFELAAKMLDVSFGNEVTSATAYAVTPDNTKNTSNTENFRKLPDLSFLPTKEVCAEPNLSVFNTENNFNNEYEISVENQVCAADSHCYKNKSNEFSSGAENITDCNTPSTIIDLHRSLLQNNKFLSGVGFPKGGGINSQRGSKRKLCDAFAQSGTVAEGMKSVSKCITETEEEELEGLSMELSPGKFDASDNAVVLQSDRMSEQQVSLKDSNLGKRITTDSNGKAPQGDVNFVGDVNFSDIKLNSGILSKEVVSDFKPPMHGFETVAEMVRVASELPKEECTVIFDKEGLNKDVSYWSINMNQENNEKIVPSITDVLTELTQAKDNISCISLESDHRKSSVSSIKALLKPVANPQLCKDEISFPKISFPGFQTAASTQVVSEQVLKEATKKFEGICADLKNCSSDGIEHMGTVPNEVKLSDEISASTSDTNSEKPCCGQKSRKLQMPSYKAVISQFQTAAGVQTSEHALSAAKINLDEVFSGSPLCNLEDNVIKKASKEKLETSFPKFRTAAGNVVNTSEQALRAAKEKLEEACANLDFCNLEENVFNCQTTVCDGTRKASDQKLGTAPGFQAVADQEVRISEEAANAIKGKLKNTEDEPEFHKSKESSCVKRCVSEHKEISQEALRMASGKKLEIPYCGFQTASGEQIKISENALNAARKKLEGTCADSGFSKTDENKEIVHNKISLLGNHSDTCYEVFQETLKSGCKKESKELKACTSEFQTRNSGEPLNSAKRKLEETTGYSELSNLKKNGHAKISGFRIQSEFQTRNSGEPLNSAKRKLEETTGYSELSNLKKNGHAKISGFSQDDLEMGKPVVNSRETSLPGFQTAAGEEMRVSDQALDIARRKLQACDSEFCDSNEVPLLGQMFKPARKNEDFPVSTCKITLPMFQTAAGEEVKVSEQALDIARRKLQVRDSNEVSQLGQIFKPARKNEDFPVSTHKITLPVFQTAAGEEVKVSEQALDIARRKLQVRDSNEVSQLRQIFKPARKNEDFPVSTHKITLPMFQTAAGEEVKVSEQALDIARRKLQACDSNEVPQLGQIFKPARKNEDFPVSTHKITLPVFQTAAGEEVKVSEQALDIARRKLQACDSNEVPQLGQIFKPARKNADFPVSSHRIALPVFQTAAGEEVRVSDQALCVAKKKFKICDDSEFFNQIATNSTELTLGSLPILSGEFEQSEEFGQANKKPVLQAHFHETSSRFPTTAGDKMGISDESLSTAKQRLAESNAKSEFCSFKTDFDGKWFSGFQTAGGREVNVSEEALNAAKKILEELPSDKENSCCSRTLFHTFQTICGDTVNISEKALFALEKKLGKISKSELHSDELIRFCNISSAEFHTDSSHKVLAKELNVAEKKILPYETSSGLHSAASDKIHISENALEVQMADLGEVYTDDQEFKWEASHQRSGTVVGDSLTESSLSETNKMNQNVSDCDLSRRVKEVTPVKGSVSHEPFGKRDSTSPFPKQGLLIPDQKSKTQMSACTGQKKEIKSKLKGCVIPGKMWLLKSSRSKQPQMGYREYAGNSVPGTYTSEELLSFGVKKSTLSITSKNAGDFVFNANEHFSSEASGHFKTVIVGDSASLILDGNFCVGKENFYRAFLTIPGVSPDLISEDWFYNHYRWIILKLASLEVSFPKIFGGRCLVPEQLMLQLKWRYDCEIDNAMRSALKKIVEKDDLSSKTLVLFVSNIFHGKSTRETSEDIKENDVSVSLCDGWYEIPAQIDSAMCQLIKQSKVVVGQKLIISGAELVGSDAACSPLEMPANLRLKVNTNSTRRARWDCKLGYFKDPRPFLVPFSSLLADGGCVSCVKVVVVRIYPITFMEKFQDGSNILRNERLENVAAERHEKLKQSCLEKLAIEVEKSMQEKTNPRRKQQKLEKLPKPLSSLSSGQEIYQVLQMANDPESIQSQLNSSQMRVLSVFLCEKQEEKMNNFAAEMKNAISEAQQQGRFPCDRVVTPLLKVFVKGILSSDRNKSGAMLNIWRPSENVFDLLTEGKVLKIYYLSVSRGKALELQLNSNKTTRYEEVVVDEEELNSVYNPRQVMSLGDIKNITHSGILQDIDVVGVVIHITPEMGSHASGSCQLVYIADAEFNSLTIRFWNGVASLGFQDLLQVGRFISASNLKIDACVDSSLPRATASVLTVFSANPKGAYLQSALQTLKSKIWDVDSFVQKAKDHLQPKLDTPKQKLNRPHMEENPVLKKQLSNSRNFHSPNISVHGSKLCNFQSPKPYPMYSPVTRLRNNVTPRRCSLVDRDALGLKTEFVNEGTLVAANSSDLSPLLSSRTKERIAALEGYGCLPSVNALPIKVSPAATKAYKSPSMSSPLIAQKKLCPGTTGKSPLNSTDCKQNFGRNGNVKKDD